MQNLYNDLAKLLEKDERVFAEGKVLKNKVTELAIKLDSQLLKLLLKNKQIKEHFFVEAEGILVFDKDKFVKFVNNKEFLPNSFTVFKNRIGLVEGDEYLKDTGKVVLAWPYKDCVLEGGQEKEDAKRDEIFYNEILAPDEIDRLFEPKVLTNFKKIDTDGEHKVEQITEQDNLIIKGNNLLALHSLKKKYRGKVKLIYIDPPYNKKGDTFYNDNFKQSSWLTFMKNRFEVAKQLLHEDGIIFIQIDVNQLAHVKVLLDDIFDKKLQSIISIKVKSPSGDSSKSERLLDDVSEYILAYAKRGSFKNLKPITIKEIVDENSKTASQYHSLLISKGRIDSKAFDFYVGNGKNKNKIEVFNVEGFQYKTVSKKDLSRDYFVERYESICRTAKFSGQFLKQFGGKKGSYYFKYTPTRGKNAGVETETYVYNSEGLICLKDFSELVELDDGSKAVAKIETATNFIDNISWQGIANEGGVTLTKGKKPEELIRRILEWTTQKNDIVMDYHVGSGTTTAVAHKLSRRYIGIEQLDYGKNDSVVRLKNVIAGEQTGISKTVNWHGGGNFICIELKEWNEEYIQAIQKAKTTKDVLAIYKKMQQEAFFRYEVDLSKFDKKQLSELPLEDQKRILIECLDKNHLYVNYSDIDDATYKIPLEEKRVNKQFYGN